MRRTLAIIICCLSAICAKAQNAYVSKIYITGQEITKEPIIRREVTLKEGDVVPISQIESHFKESKENLLNTSLFHYVDITYAETSKDQVKDQVNADTSATDLTYIEITVQVDERWYWWPFFEFKLEDKNTSSWFKHMDTDKITYNIGLKVYNLFGLGHKFELGALLGYEKGVNLKYSKLALNDKKSAYLTIEGIFARSKMIDYISLDNKLQTFKSNSVMREEVGGLVTFISRKHFRTSNQFTLSFNYTKIADSVLILNPHYWGTDAKQMRMFQFEYNYIRDYRDYKKYPTKGYLYDINARVGEGNGMDLVFLKLTAEYQLYKQLTPRWFSGHGITLGSTFKNRSAFILDQAVGYKDFNITGYDLYVIDGQHYIIQNNSIRYLLLPEKRVPLNFIKRWHHFNKPYFKIFLKALFDMGYVYQSDRHLAKLNHNTYTNRFIFGTGIGIDFLTYYDITLSFSYTVNNYGKSNFTFGFRSALF